MCGIFGIYSKSITEEHLEQLLSKSLESLKHRGYDGCGIATSCCRATSSSSPISQITRRRNARKTNNSSELQHPYPFQAIRSDRCCPRLGVAHARYRTRGACGIEQTQPLVGRQQKIALVHNGQVRRAGGLENGRDNDTFDSQMILDVFVNSYFQHRNVIAAAKSVYKVVEGSFACCVIIDGVGIVAFRDTRGIRPLCFGLLQQLPDVFEDVTEIESIAFASESYVLDGCGYSLVRDVRPGEIIFVDTQGKIRYDFAGNPDGIESASGGGGIQISCNSLLGNDIVKIDTAFVDYSPCLFEYIYLAHPSSIIDGIHVGDARKKMGEWVAPKLAARGWGGNQIDVVIPVPNTPNEAAQALVEYLRRSNLKNMPKYVELLKVPKKRSESRTFILATPKQRRKALATKFDVDHTLIHECFGKRIAIVDDSIVRGTTMGYMVEFIKDLLDPKRITLVSLAPPIRFENRYGIDLPDRRQLIANGRTPARIAKELGVDDIVYGNITDIISGLRAIAHTQSVALTGFECSVFVGEQQ